MLFSVENVGRITTSKNKADKWQHCVMHPKCFGLCPAERKQLVKVSIRQSSRQLAWWDFFWFGNGWTFLTLGKPFSIHWILFQTCTCRIVMDHLSFGSIQVNWSHFRVQVESVSWVTVQISMGTSHGILLKSLVHCWYVTRVMIWLQHWSYVPCLLYIIIDRTVV